MLRSVSFTLAAALALLTATGCSSGQRAKGLGDVLYDVAGEYTSTETIGSLGHVHLHLEHVEDTQTVYRAELSSEDNPDLGVSKGVGTIGADHVILNFDRGQQTDYYFQGFVQLYNDNVVGIDGTFIEPDLNSPVAVLFVISQ
jgi:hypothetical protein